MMKKNYQIKLKNWKKNNVEVQGVVEIAENEDVKTLENEQIEKIINSLEIIIEDSSEIISEGSSDSELDTKEDMVPVISPDDNAPTFRVQIGAFNRKIQKSVFKGIPNVVGIKGERRII